MDWKQSLDRYLTTDPNEGMYCYYDDVCERLSDPFFAANELWIQNTNPLLDKWINKCYYKRIKPTVAAAMIERLCAMFKHKIWTGETQVNNNS
jgi:hypothetical protein